MTYFFDTCALLHNFKKDLPKGFYISSITLKELENIKTSCHKDEEVKYQARQLLHKLEKADYNVELYNSYLDEYLTSYDLPDTNDSKIIATALALKTKYPDLVFCTQDLACKTIAKATGLNVKYEDEEVAEEYTGFIEKVVNDDELAEFYSNIQKNKINPYNLLLNQYLILKNSNGEIVDKYKWGGDELGYLPLCFSKSNSTYFGKISPKDIYQQLAFDALQNHQLVMLRGAAGTGKSYLSFSYLFDLLEKNKIEKIIIFCNTVATKGSAKLGFYPGSRDEKLLDSQIGNLLSSKIGGKAWVEKLIEDNQLVLLPMSDIRGYDTTGMNAAVYISEAQNLDIELMKLALQRIGEDSICILDGDSNAQVDSSLYAGANNGMRRVSEVFRGQDIYAEVTLQNIHRSKIAAIADLV